MAERHDPRSSSASVQRQRAVRTAGGEANRVAALRLRVHVDRRRRCPAVLHGVWRGPVLEAPQGAAVRDPAGLGTGGTWPLSLVDVLGALAGDGRREKRGGG